MRRPFILRVELSVRGVFLASRTTGTVYFSASPVFFFLFFTLSTIL